MHPYLNIAVKAARSASKFLIDATLHLNLLEVRDHDKKNSPSIENIINKVESTLINQILRAYPQHNIRSGNFEEANNSDITWIIEPLNGISNFIHKIPFFAISIAICKGDIVEHGLIYNPMLDELFVASKGNGAQFNNRKIRVSNNKKISELLIALQNKSLNAKQAALFNHFCINLGSEALHLALVASGRLDGYYGFKVDPLSIQAGILLVKESGGYVTDISPLGFEINEHSILASNPKVFTELNSIISCL